MIFEDCVIPADALLGKEGDGFIDAMRTLDGGRISIGALAERTRVPEKFLEQILLVLRNAEFLKSRRGVEGGYALNRPSSEIRLGESRREAKTQGARTPAPPKPRRPYREAAGRTEVRAP